MRIENWKAQEVFTAIVSQAEENANVIMDDVVAVAKAKCPVDPVTFREGKFASASVSFTPKTGKNKGQLVQFTTDKRWMGRAPGNLRETIRRVNRPGSGKIRVYAGNFKIYWALMIEKTGYHDRSGKFHAPVHFLQAPFHAIKGQIIARIKGGK